MESGQRVELRAPVVAFTDEGARTLGRVYWAVVARSTAGLVRRRRASPGTVLCILGRWPALLRFGEPEIEVSPSLVVCRYPITGGLLARRPGGDISFAQSGGEQPDLRSSIRGFFPQLAARTGGPRWTGALYEHLQSRAHVAISRRYFTRLLEGGRT